MKKTILLIIMLILIFSMKSEAKKNKNHKKGKQDNDCAVFTVMSTVEDWKNNNKTFGNITLDCMNQIYLKTQYTICSQNQGVGCCNLKFGIHFAIADSPDCIGVESDPNDDHWAAIYNEPYSELYKEVCKKCPGCP